MFVAVLRSYTNNLLHHCIKNPVHIQQLLCLIKHVLPLQYPRARVE